MSVKSKLTLAISLLVMLFLTLDVILNDYSTRVNLRSEAEASMTRLAKQVAETIDQNGRLRAAYEQEMTARLHLSARAAASLLPENLKEIDRAAIRAAANAVKTDSLSILAASEEGLEVIGSSNEQLIGSLENEAADKLQVPVRTLAVQEAEGEVQQESAFVVMWPAGSGEEDGARQEIRAYLAKAGRDYVVSVGINNDDTLELLEKSEPRQLIDDLLAGQRDLMEIAVLDPGSFTEAGAMEVNAGTDAFMGTAAIQYGRFTPGNKLIDQADVAAAAAGKMVFRSAVMDGKSILKGYIGFEEPYPLVVSLVMDEAFLFENLNQQRMNRILISGALLVLVVMASYIISGWLIRPVHSILSKVNDVADGQFDTVLEVRSSDEMGQLAQQVNAMSKNLAVYTNKLQSAFEENRTMKEYLQSFINHTSDAIHVEQTDGTIVQVNQAFEMMFGWTAEEAIGARLQLVPEQYSREEQQALDEIAAGKLLPARETVRQRKDGNWMNVSVTTSPIRDNKGIIRAYASITRDMTSRYKMDELLRRSEKLNTVGQLAAGVAHEIRNPLTTLRGFLQLQQQTQKLNVGHVDLMLSELDRINLIVSEFLILAKPQASKFELKDVRYVLGDVVSLLDSQAHLCNVVFNTDFTQEECEIACEENQLKQVFINVLKNAIEAMPRGGEVNIVVEKRKRDTIAVSITDQGVGIPEEMIPKLGDPFVTGKETGTGLGIMVSQRIIQSHQGTMDITSKVDVGTTVVITLPAVTE
ncbi:sensor histidine kinase [Paenibacillus sambharensis]|nr:sensor histidine kinase [Paenibacillus sambharensis]